MNSEVPNSLDDREGLTDVAYIIYQFVGAECQSTVWYSHVVCYNTAINFAW
jgi:hypothetical protein